jgi:mannose-6-phosphate isomerase
MVPIAPRPYLMVNPIQHYAWGMRGNEAYIPHLLGMEAQADLPCAELWMGAHPKAPSDLVVDGSRVSLLSLIEQDPQGTLGREIAARSAGTLPFLLKIVSVARPLSIQAHPDRTQARILHARDPEHYPDSNHKPELAIGLDSLTAFVGFKRLADILHCMDRYPELADLIGADTVRDLRERGEASTQEHLAPREIFAALLRRSAVRKDLLAESIGRLRLRLGEHKDSLREEEEIFLELSSEYPDDVGAFSALLMNLVHLAEGQAVFIAAGVPHLYVRGNAIECMANSDNVVRGGLTPKFKDIDALLEILAYDASPVALLGEGDDSPRRAYRTPAGEFRVCRCRQQAGEEVGLAGGTPQVLLVTKGTLRVRWATASGEERQEFHQGQSLFIPAGLSEYAIAAMSSTEIYQAAASAD